MGPRPRSRSGSRGDRRDRRERAARAAAARSSCACGCDRRRRTTMPPGMAGPSRTEQSEPGTWWSDPCLPALQAKYRDVRSTSGIARGPLSAPRSGSTRTVRRSVRRRRRDRPRFRRGSRARAGTTHATAWCDTAWSPCATHISASVPTSAGSCSTGQLRGDPLRTSVKVGPWWQRAHPAGPRNTSRPRAAAARSKLPPAATATRDRAGRRAAAAASASPGRAAGVMRTPMRGSWNEPWPPIWPTPT